ncbi:Phospholipase A1 [Apis cerana cerana]|uniref:phospholipase A1 n=1 Tax=Apis cerana cerana TaxID=94128 RepID=A0A2A3EBU7_APICC|nr:Phospholipase A1 [Apis cerana cerana]
MVANASLALIVPTLLQTLATFNYTVFPDGDGVPHLVHLDNTPLSLEEVGLLNTNLNTITFTLFTRNNRAGDRLVLNDMNSIKNSKLNSAKNTIIITHGWNSAGTTEACTLVRNVWDSNVIIVDWSTIAKNIYSTAAKSVPNVANHVASFVNFLRTKFNLQTSKLTMVGHSLGAHIMSLAAKSVSTYSKVAEVVALDPAKPLFDIKNANGRVDKSHALNVQVIHTCPGLLGLDKSVGTSDFYANDGRKQPGCNNDLLGACAHGRSYEYYSESITNPKGFPSTPKSFLGLKTTVYMGGSVLDRNARGSYNFKTGSKPPYALG